MEILANPILDSYWLMGVYLLSHWSTCLVLIRLHVHPGVDIFMVFTWSSFIVWIIVSVENATTNLIYFFFPKSNLVRDEKKITIWFD